MRDAVEPGAALLGAVDLVPRRLATPVDPQAGHVVSRDVVIRAARAAR
jgi:hypothetical protein